MDGQDRQDKSAAVRLFYHITVLVGLDSGAETERLEEKKKIDHEKRARRARKAKGRNRQIGQCDTWEERGEQ
jgi:hypothetical protein